MMILVNTLLNLLEVLAAIVLLGLIVLAFAGVVVLVYCVTFGIKSMHREATNTTDPSETADVSNTEKKM